MKKINSFHIIRLSISGFKCFEEKIVFDFGDMTYITASNGKGKSSIADAISYTFMGTPFFGGNGLDRLQNGNASELEVSVDIVDDIGTEHTLTRSRKKGVTVITYDGFEIKQTDITEMFCDKDIFLSIFNPMYFIDVLGESGRGMLEKLLPVVSHEDVLAAMSERSRELLKDESMLSPETYIKYRRTELKELEESQIRYTAQKELLERQREECASNAEYVALSDAIGYVSANWKCPVCMTVMTKQEANEVMAELQQRHSGFIRGIQIDNLLVEENLSTSMLETVTKIACLKTLVSEAIQYAATRAKLALEGLKMNRAEIVLSEIIKSTGEVKDCFRFSYNGRDYRCLSLSEKIKAGLEVSELIKRLSGRNYPVFIDNGESICAIDNVKPSGQVIYSRVVRDKELKITRQNNNQ